jgi:hypothetical protein
MMMKQQRNILFIFVLLVFSINYSMAQVETDENEKPKNWSLNGYVKYMNTVSFVKINDAWLTDNLIHNRLSFNWYPNIKWTFNLQARNRFYYGSTVALIPNYEEFTGRDFGFFDLSETLLKNNSSFLQSDIDRVNIRYEKNKWNITIGRQRINWGQTFAFNPNDIFNAYSYFDFDYAEKQGSDAIRFQYYPSYTSRFELAAKLDNEDKLTFAGLYQFNKWQYDMQFIGGCFAGEDVVVGTGFSGNLLKGGFRGEMTYFHPIDELADTNGVIVASLGYDYSLKNGIFLQAEMLYNSNAEENWNFNLSEFYSQAVTAKNLSLNEWSFLAVISLPISPLINFSFSSLYSPKNNLIFLGTSCTFSVSENFEADLNIQSFTSDIQSSQGGKGSYAFLRGRWSF